MSERGLQLAQRKMTEAGVPDAAISVFTRYYRQIESGASGLIGEDEIEPVPDLPELAQLDVDAAAVRAAADATVVIKLNGGLGTSMGLDRAKSLLRVKDDLTFLDVIVRQVLHAREQHGARLPLVFMNSFRTRDDTQAVLDRYPQLRVGDLPPDFLQNREPKLRVDTLEPVEWLADPSLEWCPPGHADVYPALLETGLLDQLLADGYRYAFCSNADNLGATVEPRIAVLMARHDVPFLVESTRRTPADRKGGHLAIRRSDGRLVLRETAQTSEQDMAALQDLDRHRYCNTNNLWVDLVVLRDVLRAQHGDLQLPLIRNEKTVDPTDASSPKVIQIEAAIGAAVEAFEGARSVLVPRSRFVPVKTTNDLLVLRSDAYELQPDATLHVGPGRKVGDDPYVDLDADYYKTIKAFEARFPAGPVSLLRCERFVVEGDVTFEADVVAEGDVTVRAADGPRTVPAGTRLADHPSPP